MTQLEALCVGPMLDLCPLGVAVLDGEGRIQGVNTVLAQYSGLPAEHLLGHDRTSLGEERLGYLFEPHETVRLRRSGEPDLWLRCWSLPLPGQEQGARLHYYLDISEIVGLRRQRDRLRSQVDDLRPVDPITGLMGRTAMLHMLESQVTRSRRYGNPFSLIQVSLDSPYDVDEGAPTELSEYSVRAISGTLKDQLRWADLIARMEDRRFMLILPETHAKDTVALVSKLRRGLRDLQLIDEDGREIIFSVRFGVSEWVRGDDVNSLTLKVEESLANAALAHA
ncbi:MAG: diguanylate cyclase [Chromatiales bacterium]|nr:diguanylate cyclase [Chromatiales bacterium]